MKRSERIQPVSKIAGRAERKAALELAKTRVQLRDLQSKLDTMKTYRKEYERKQGDTHTKISIKHLKNNQVFLEQLDEAITILEKQINKQSELTLQDREKWISTWKHLNSLNKAIDNLQTREKQKAERREQGQLDEHALQSR